MEIEAARGTTLAHYLVWVLDVDAETQLLNREHHQSKPPKDNATQTHLQYESLVFNDRGFHLEVFLAHVLHRHDRPEKGAKYKEYKLKLLTL